MWARNQMSQWSQEAKVVAEEKKRKGVTVTNKDAAVSSTQNQNSSSSESSSNESSLWMMQKVETVRKLSGVLSSLVSDSEK